LLAIGLRDAGVLEMTKVRIPSEIIGCDPTRKARSAKKDFRDPRQYSWQWFLNSSAPAEMIQSVTVSDLARLLAELLEEARGRHDRTPSGEEIESATFLIFQAMTGRARDCHGLAHLFNGAEGFPPLVRLAAICHDIVYFHVDGGFPPSVCDRIGDAMERSETLSETSS
jgi:hypothetical protein